MSPKITTLKTSIASSIQAVKASIKYLNFDDLPDSGFIRESQLVQSPKQPATPAPLPFSAPTLWRKVKAGTFPKPHSQLSLNHPWRDARTRSAGLLDLFAGVCHGGA